MARHGRLRQQAQLRRGRPPHRRLRRPGALRPPGPGQDSVRPGQLLPLEQCGYRPDWSSRATQAIGGELWVISRTVSSSSRADILEEDAKESAKKLGNGHLGIKHDVRKADSAKNLVDQTLEKFGHIDVLVNNAGVGPNPAPIQDLTEEEFDRVLDINLRGVVLTTRAVVPHLIKQKSGRIINLSPIVGQTGFAMIVPYAASKFAVIGVTQ